LKDRELPDYGQAIFMFISVGDGAQAEVRHARNTKNQAFLSHSIRKLHTDLKEIIFGVSGSGFKLGSL
jgi:hypothetical protein